MKKAIYVLLGSNFDSNQEVNMRFIRELIHHDYQISVYSVDNYAPKVAYETYDKISITRIERHLTPININQLVSEIALKDNHIDLFIVLDGIDFKDIIFGNQVKNKMQHHFKYLPDLPVIHFISPNYECPIFNNKSISDFDFTDFSLTSIFSNNENKIIVNDIQKLTQIENQISRYKDKYVQIFMFMKSPGFNLIFSNPDEARQLIKNELTKHICDQIDLNTIGFSQNIKLKPGF